MNDKIVENEVDLNEKIKKLIGSELFSKIVFSRIEIENRELNANKNQDFELIDSLSNESDEDDDDDEIENNSVIEDEEIEIENELEFDITKINKGKGKKVNEEKNILVNE